MSRLLDLGRRVELHSMDPHHQDISIALYRTEQNPPEYRAHSYSELPGAQQRVVDVVDGICRLGGLQPGQGGPTCLCFDCGQDHLLAMKRAFLESCKLPEPGSATPCDLNIVDRKSGLTIQARGLGDGQYRIEATNEAGNPPEDADNGARRVGVIVNGLRKLGDMLAVEDADGQLLNDCVSFDCGHDHDALVGLLLQRAPNVRALVREQEAAAARGVLAAPSAQR